MVETTVAEAVVEEEVVVVDGFTAWWAKMLAKIMKIFEKLFGWMK